MKKVLLVLLSLLLASCDYKVHWEDEMYAVYQIDNSPVSLGIKVGEHDYIKRFIAPFSVGSNDEYLVIKNSTGYTYVVKSEDSWKFDNKEGHFGPFDEPEFNEIKKKLGLPDFESDF